MKAPIDPTRKLAMEMDASKVLIEQLRDLSAGDEEFLSDLVEGETGIFEIIAAIDKSELDDRIMISGLDEHIKKLQERKRKAAERAEMKRALMASALDQIGLRTHKTALGTITISAKTPTAIVIEESDIPTKFWEAQPPQLARAELNKALRARQAALDAAMEIKDADERAAALATASVEYPEIPGATLSNAGVQITIRR